MDEIGISLVLLFAMFKAQIKTSVSGEQTLKKISQVSKKVMQPNTQVKFYHAERRSKSNKVSMELERIERRFKLSFNQE